MTLAQLRLTCYKTCQPRQSHAPRVKTYETTQSPHQRPHVTQGCALRSEPGHARYDLDNLGIPWRIGIGDPEPKKERADCICIAGNLWAELNQGLDKGCTRGQAAQAGPISHVQRYEQNALCSIPQCGEDALQDRSNYLRTVLGLRSRDEGLALGGIQHGGFRSGVGQQV